MPRQVMRRQASDNEYLHQDFHGALSTGLDYLEETYGEEAVREYLRQFADSYYSPLKQDLARRGLAALAEHFSRVYEIEHADVQIVLGDDELVIRVPACPAVTHMRERGYKVARLFVETTRTVNEALCEGSDFMAELLEYDEETGRSVQRFSRRPGR